MNSNLEEEFIISLKNERDRLIELINLIDKLLSINVCPPIENIKKDIRGDDLKNEIIEYLNMCEMPMTKPEITKYIGSKYKLHNCDRVHQAVNTLVIKSILCKIKLEIIEHFSQLKNLNHTTWQQNVNRGK